MLLCLVGYKMNRTSLRRRLRELLRRVRLSWRNIRLCIKIASEFREYVTLSCRLQDEYNKLEEEIKRTIEESKIVQEKYKTMYEDSRREVAERNAQMEELRHKVSYN